jgi:hypothetical protein
MIDLVQRGLEGLYRLETDVDVNDFLIDTPTRAALGAGGAAREELLVAERDGEVELALFVDERALANLAANDPRRRLDDGNLQDFLLAVEGASHFVYFVWRAQQARPVSALELELQGEIDKYVTCLLTLMPQVGGPPDGLRERLFERFELRAGMGGEERERYLTANSNARAYAASLDSRYLERGAVTEMLDELRRFYRLGVGDKLSYIAQAA